MPAYTVPLLRIRDEAEGTKTYIFEKPGGFIYRAGQSVVVRVPTGTGKPQDDLRTFTLASSPTEDVLMLSMRHGPSAFKQYFSRMSIGDAVVIMGPSGHFTLHEDRSIPAVFLAGGIGIVPFRTMMKYALDSGAAPKMCVLYSNPSVERIAFRTELDDWRQQFGCVSVAYTITRPPIPEGWRGLSGRFDAATIQACVPDCQQPIWYICGPGTMVSEMKDLLEGELGIAQSRIRFEIFTGY